MVKNGKVVDCQPAPPRRQYYPIYLWLLILTSSVVGFVKVAVIACCIVAACAAYSVRTAPAVSQAFCRAQSTMYISVSATSQCSTVVRSTVVTAMMKVNEKHQTLGPLPPQPIVQLTRNLVRLITSGVRLHTPKLWKLTSRGHPGTGVKYHVQRLFNFLWFLFLAMLIFGSITVVFASAGSI